MKKVQGSSISETATSQPVERNLENEHFSKSIIFDHFASSKMITFEKVSFRYRKSIVLESIVSLTFDINGIDAFQKVMISEESAALPGKETFGGVQKVFVFKNEHFPDIGQKVYEFPMVLEQKVFVFPMVLNDFPEMLCF